MLTLVRILKIDSSIDTDYHGGVHMKYECTQELRKLFPNSPDPSVQIDGMELTLILVSYNTGNQIDTHVFKHTLQCLLRPKINDITGTDLRVMIAAICSV